MKWGWTLEEAMDINIAFSDRGACQLHVMYSLGMSGGDGAKGLVYFSI